MTSMLTLEHVGKRYGARTVLRDLSFTAERGEIIALLGRNGAGKSTLMNVITGYLAMTEGCAAVAGFDVQLQPRQARRQTGYLPETPPLYPDMTVREYLRYCADLKGIPRRAQKAALDEVIERTALSDYADRLCGRLSKGYKQRLGLAQALLGHPPALILDEPGSGLDPVQMAQMRDLIREIGKDSAVLLSSHMLSEVTSVCTRALVLHGGTFRFDGPMDTLLRGEGRLHLLWRGDEALFSLLGELNGARQVRRLPSPADLWAAEVLHDPRVDLRAAAFHRAVQMGAEVLELSSRQTNLEDAFLRLIQEDHEA